MGQVFFYHLTRQPLESVLPMLLGKARQAGWCVVVRGSNPQRLEYLDEKLWLGPEEGFLPHGRAGGEFDADQPILLTNGPELSNGAACVMAVDGAEVTAQEVQGLVRPQDRSRQKECRPVPAPALPEQSLRHRQQP